MLFSIEPEFLTVKKVTSFSSIYKPIADDSKTTTITRETCLFLGQQFLYCWG